MGRRVAERPRVVLDLPELGAARPAVAADGNRGDKGAERDGPGVADHREPGPPRPSTAPARGSSPAHGRPGRAGSSLAREDRPGRALDPGLPGGCRIARGRPAGEEDRPVRRHAPRDDRRERIGACRPAARGGSGSRPRRPAARRGGAHRCRAGIPGRDLPERPGARKRVRTRFARRARAGGRARVIPTPRRRGRRRARDDRQHRRPRPPARRRRDGIGRRGGRARPGRPEHRAPTPPSTRSAARPASRSRPGGRATSGAPTPRCRTRPRGRRSPARPTTPRSGARAARAGRAAVIPPRAGRESPRPHDREPREARHPVENSFAGLKRHRAIATRHDGRAVPFPSAIHLAATLISPDRGHALGACCSNRRHRDGSAASHAFGILSYGSCTPIGVCRRRDCKLRHWPVRGMLDRRRPSGHGEVVEHDRGRRMDGGLGCRRGGREARRALRAAPLEEASGRSGPGSRADATSRWPRPS